MKILSTPDILIDRIEEQQQLYAHLKEIVQMYKLQKRILIQAVLASGGKLQVDPAFGEQAQKLVNDTDFLICNGAVELLPTTTQAQDVLNTKS